MLSRVLWRAVTDLMPGFYCQVKLELSETIYWSRKPRGQVGVGSAESFRMGSLCTLMVGFGAPAQHPLPGAVSPGVLWMPTGAEDLQHHQTWKLCCPVWLGMVWGAPWHPQQQQKVDLGVFLERHWQGKKNWCAAAPVAKKGMLLISCWDGVDLLNFIKSSEVFPTHPSHRWGCSTPEQSQDLIHAAQLLEETRSWLG